MLSTLSQVGENRRSPSILTTESISRAIDHQYTRFRRAAREEIRVNDSILRIQLCLGPRTASAAVTTALPFALEFRFLFLQQLFAHACPNARLRPALCAADAKHVQTSRLAWSAAHMREFVGLLRLAEERV
jgi:hypothetical protein